MSHMVEITTKIQGLDMLERACRRLGLNLMRGKTKARYYGNKVVTCDHAIEVPSCGFDIGVKKQSDKSYLLMADFYGQEGRKLEEVCGKELGRLKQAYQAVVAKVVAQSKGFTVEETKVNGKQRVRCWRMVQ